MTGLDWIKITDQQQEMLNSLHLSYRHKSSLHEAKDNKKLKSHLQKLADTQMNSECLCVVSSETSSTNRGGSRRWLTGWMQLLLVQNPLVNSWAPPFFPSFSHLSLSSSPLFPLLPLFILPSIFLCSILSLSSPRGDVGKNEPTLFLWVFKEC